MRSQDLLGEWADQSDKIIFKNINISSYYTWTDQSNSYLSFITKPKKALLTVLEECEALEETLR
jgi:hypothetical protein